MSGNQITQATVKINGAYSSIELQINNATKIALSGSAWPSTKILQTGYSSVNFAGFYVDVRDGRRLSISGKADGLCSSISIEMSIRLEGRDLQVTQYLASVRDWIDLADQAEKNGEPIPPFQQEIPASIKNVVAIKTE